jgi:vacuolar iron transporter family protein
MVGRTEPKNSAPGRRPQSRPPAPRRRGRLARFLRPSNLRGGASTGGGAVRLAGVAGLLAGAFSMAAGELVSVKAHDDLVRHEIAVERDELANDPQGEQRELAAMYRARGVAPADADTVARILMAIPEVALDTHVRLELGVDPDSEGSSRQAAVVSFASFSSGAILPLMPWFFISGS